MLQLLEFISASAERFFGFLLGFLFVVTIIVMAITDIIKTLKGCH